jgi:hypothetical protein
MHTVEPDGFVGTDVGDPVGTDVGDAVGAPLSTGPGLVVAPGRGAVPLEEPPPQPMIDAAAADRTRIKARLLMRIFRSFTF